MPQGFRLGRLPHPDPARRYDGKRARPPVFIAVATKEATDVRDELVARVAALPVEYRRACFDLPIAEDPLYPVLRALYPDGARLLDIGLVYGFTLERIRQIGDKARERVEDLLDGHVIERGPSVWDELEAAS